MGDLGSNSQGGYQVKWVTGMAALADSTTKADISLDTFVSCGLIWWRPISRQRLDETGTHQGESVLFLYV